MRLLLALLLAVPLCAGVIIKNPYSPGGGNWYIGALHFHTNNSDGSGTPAEMADAYHTAGFHFGITTDHRSAAYPAADDGCTPDPAHAGFLWILGEEQGTAVGDLAMLGLTARVQVPWVGSQAAQIDVDACRTNSGLAMIVHPGYPDTYIPGANHWIWWSEIYPLRRFSLIEMYNRDYIDSSTNYIDSPVDLWDEYFQIWGTANDDAHNKTTHVNRYCQVVQTASAVIVQADILSSLDSGNHYMRMTATGPSISSISVVGSTITLTYPASYTTHWYVKNKRLAETDNAATSASYTVASTDGYVQAWIYDGTKWAWTQPFFIINDTDFSASATASGGTAANLIDNDLGTTCDLGAETGSFVVDVGSARQLNGIRIYWTDVDSRRFNYKVEESTTGAFGGEETEILRTTNSNREATTTDVFDCWSRYIKVTVTGLSVGVGNAIIKEVEAFDASPETSYLYLNTVAGNDANTGLSAAQAWKAYQHLIRRVRPRKVGVIVNGGSTYAWTKPEDYDGNQSWGKHAGAWWEVRGSGMPVSSAVLQVGNANAKYWRLRGLAATGGTWGVRVAGGNYAEVIGCKLYSNTYGISAVSTDNLTLACNICYSNSNTGIIDYVTAGYTTSIYNNICYSNTNYGISIGNTIHTVRVRNNVSWSNGIKDYYITTNCTLIDSNNCGQNYLSDPACPAWAKTNNVDVLPQFVNMAGLDFRLKASSPLRSKGYNVSLTLDYTGQRIPAWTGKVPDIGAYEMRPVSVSVGVL